MRSIDKLFPQAVSGKPIYRNLGAQLQADEAVAKTRIRHIFSAKIKDRIVKSLNELSPESIREIIETADSICKHQIALFEKKYALGESIEWNKDIYADYEWPLQFSAGMRVINLSDSSDVKFPWELNRFFHAIPLGQAYWFTEDEKYAEEFVTQVEAWAEQNPINRGINWNCSMEVGIRAVNLCWAYGFFIESRRLSREFHALFLNLIFRHAKHIFSNLENKGPVKGNHYIADLVGLLCISTFFPVFKRSSKWKSFATKELIKEMQAQVNGDGTSFEGSIPYHRFVTEMFLHAAILEILNEKLIDQDNIGCANVKAAAERVLGENYIRRLESMCEFILAYTKPDGLAPQIGDNDNGRLIKFGWSSTDVNDHRHILAIAGEFFNREDFRREGAAYMEDAVWLFRGQIKLPKGQSLEVQSKGFPGAGIYIMRKKGDYLIVRCAGLGTSGKGTHTHNDNLSFELCANGITYIVDPGTFTYSRNLTMRNLFRSTSYHNTLVIDGLEQNDLSETDLFLLHEKCKTKALNWENMAHLDVFSGECSIESENGGCVTHKRDIYFDKRRGRWKIQDRVLGTGFHELLWYFHANSGITVEIHSKFALFRQRDYGDLKVIFDNNYEVKDVVKGWYSSSYGLKEQADILVLGKSVELPFRSSFEFVMN